MARSGLITALKPATAAQRGDSTSRGGKKKRKKRSRSRSRSRTN